MPLWLEITSVTRSDPSITYHWDTASPGSLPTWGAGLVTQNAAPRQKPDEILPDCPTCSNGRGQCYWRIQHAQDADDRREKLRRRWGWSSHPVRYGDGTVFISSTDLTSARMAFHGREAEWTNAPGFDRVSTLATRP